MIPRTLHRLLIRHPGICARLLRWSGRGSLERRLFLLLIREGQVICDIGANRGDFTRLFCELVGAGGEVHAFEPGRETFARLERSFGSDGPPANCHLNALALGEAAGTVMLHQPGTDDGQASLRTHSHGSWSSADIIHQHECRMTTLDDYAAGMRRLDFVKCDVEGAELTVLKGATATLAKFSPLLFVEVFEEWTRAFDYRPSDLLRFLADAGYTHVYLAADCTLTRIAADAAITGPANLLCAKRGVLPDVLEA